MSVVEVRDPSNNLCIIHVEKILYMKRTPNREYEIVFTGEGGHKLILTEREAKKVYAALEKTNA